MTQSSSQLINERNFVPEQLCCELLLLISELRLGDVDSDIDSFIENVRRFRTKIKPGKNMSFKTSNYTINEFNEWLGTSKTMMETTKIDSNLRMCVAVCNDKLVYKIRDSDGEILFEHRDKPPICFIRCLSGKSIKNLSIPEYIKMRGIGMLEKFNDIRRRDDGKDNIIQTHFNTYHWTRPIVDYSFGNMIIDSYINRCEIPGAMLYMWGSLKKYLLHSSWFPSRRIFYIYGIGGTGKSTVVNVIGAMFGGNATTNIEYKHFMTTSFNEFLDTCCVGLNDIQLPSTRDSITFVGKLKSITETVQYINSKYKTPIEIQTRRLTYISSNDIDCGYILNSHYTEENFKSSMWDRIVPLCLIGGDDVVTCLAKMYSESPKRIGYILMQAIINREFNIDVDSSYNSKEKEFVFNSFTPFLNQEKAVKECLLDWTVNNTHAYVDDIPTALRTDFIRICEYRRDGVWKMPVERYNKLLT